MKLFHNKYDIAYVTLNINIVTTIFSTIISSQKKETRCRDTTCRASEDDLQWSNLCGFKAQIMQKFLTILKNIQIHCTSNSLKLQNDLLP